MNSHPVLSKLPADRGLPVSLGWDGLDVTGEAAVDIDLWYIDLACYEVTLPRGKAGGQIVYVGNNYGATLVMRRLACFRPRMRRVQRPLADLDLGTIYVSVMTS